MEFRFRTGIMFTCVLASLTAILCFAIKDWSGMSWSLIALFGAAGLGLFLDSTNSDGGFTS